MSEEVRSYVRVGSDEVKRFAAGLEGVSLRSGDSDGLELECEQKDIPEEWLALRDQMRAEVANLSLPLRYRLAQLCLRPHQGEICLRASKGRVYVLSWNSTQASVERALLLEIKEAFAKFPDLLRDADFFFVLDVSYKAQPGTLTLSRKSKSGKGLLLPSAARLSPLQHSCPGPTWDSGSLISSFHEDIPQDERFLGYLWRHRLERLFWRGLEGGNSSVLAGALKRLQVIPRANVSMLYSLREREDLCKKPTLLCDSKYLVHLASPSSEESLLLKLLCGSPVLSPPPSAVREEWWTSALRADVHFKNVSKSFGDADKKVMELRRNQKRAAKIGFEGRRLALAVSSASCRVCYFKELLSEVSKSPVYSLRNQSQGFDMDRYGVLKADLPSESWVRTLDQVLVGGSSEGGLNIPRDAFDGGGWTYAEEEEEEGEEEEESAEPEYSMKTEEELEQERVEKKQRFMEKKKALAEALRGVSAELKRGNKR